MKKHPPPRLNRNFFCSSAGFTTPSLSLVHVGKAHLDYPAQVVAMHKQMNYHRASPARKETREPQLARTSRNKGCSLCHTCTPQSRRMNKHLHMTAALALALTSAACADDLTQSTSRAVEAPAPESRQDLASSAVAALVTDRSQPFQIFIPDATREPSSAVVELIRSSATSRYRFERDANGWRIGQHLGTEQHAAAAAPAGVLLDRKTWTSGTLAGTPQFAQLNLDYRPGQPSYPDSTTLEPVRYQSGSLYRWTQSGQVVSGYEEGIKWITRAAFRLGNVQWFTADSAFTVSAHRKWTYGDTNGQQGECVLSVYNTPCLPAVPRAGTTAWVDAYYDIQVAKRTATTVTIAPNTAITLSPGQSTQLTATVRDQFGQTFGQAVTWTSSNTAVATVSSTGSVSITGIGSATITATAGSASASVPVTGEYNVTLSAPSYAYNTYVTVTASVLPAGSYHYTWTEESCDFSVSLFCTTKVNMPSGQNVTSTQTHISRYDGDVFIKVVIRATAGGAILDQQAIRIRGANEAIGGGGCHSRVC